MRGILIKIRTCAISRWSTDWTGFLVISTSIKVLLSLWCTKNWEKYSLVNLRRSISPNSTMFTKAALRALYSRKMISPIMHLICPPPPTQVSTTSVSFLLGITAVPRKIENNAYSKFWGANKVHHGRCVSGVFTDSSLANHT